jgi:uncharacterized protein
MAHFATKRFNYWGQLGVLTGLVGAGLIIGSFASFVPLAEKIDLSALFDGTLEKKINAILIPENSTIFRWSQSIAAVFLFMIPVLLYSRICHVKAGMNLGFRSNINFMQVLLAILIMLACAPVADLLEQLTRMLPWSNNTLLKFKAAEEVFNKQILVIARMNDAKDYVISLFVIALLPAITEELLFRGAIQNLLSRWLKKPILAIVITSAIFSAVHFSYFGFLSRFALGFALGWMYYRTGNLWLSIIGHFATNSLAATALYLATGPGKNILPAQADDHFPIVLGLLGIAVVVGLFIAFEKAGKKEIDRPGEEVLISGYNFSNNPFLNDIAAQQQGSQQ